MMGALMVQGLQPGPLLFVEKAPDVYAIFIGLLLANVIMGIMGFSLIRLFMKVVNVPVHILLPIIVMMTFVGTYSYNNSLNDVYLMVASGFLGYFMNKLGFSMSATAASVSSSSVRCACSSWWQLFYPCFRRFLASCSKEAKFYLTNSLRLAKLSM